MEHRGAFSTVEASFQSLFELISYATTIIYSQPDQFTYAVVISVGAVYLAGGLYAAFVRRRRGHLFHSPASRCLCAEKLMVRHQTVSYTHLTLPTMAVV